MATSSVGLIGGNGCAGSSTSWFQIKNRKKKNHFLRNNRINFFCSSSSSVLDPYKTLKIQPGASESEVKKAFRRLALQYHPDVCRGSNCTVQFSQINEAYDILMNSLRGEAENMEMFQPYDDEQMRGTNDPDWEMWEEWMGWEGAGIRDYSSHINPYI